MSNILDDLIYTYVGRLKPIVSTYKKRDHIVNGVTISGWGYFEGSAFENTQDTTYSPIKYVLVHSNTGKIIDEVISNNGNFRFDDLNMSEKFSIIVLDMNNKYIGKYLDSLTPSIDYQRYLNINQIYRKGDQALYKFRYSGQPTVTITGNANISKIDEFTYIVTNIQGEYKITLVDFIDNRAYYLEKTY